MTKKDRKNALLVGGGLVAAALAWHFRDRLKGWFGKAGDLVGWGETSGEESMQ